MSLEILGTPTSPYVRKVRILLAAIGVPHVVVDTREALGAERLAAVAPLGKVPVLIAGDQVVPDSALITHWLWRRYPDALRAAGFALDPDDLDDRARQTVVEGCMDAAIHRFYVLKDLPDRGYVTKQGDRVRTSLRWLDGRSTFARPVRAASLSLGCMLEWMQFRDVVELRAYPGLTRFLEDWRASGVGKGTEPA